MTCVPVFGCGVDIDDVLDDKQSSDTWNGPRQRSTKAVGVRCFESFSGFKRAMEKEGKSRRHDGKQWHHIVPQHSANRAKFGQYDLHCTDNLVYLEKAMHKRLNAHYSRKLQWTGNKTVRDWLKPKSFDEQYDYGQKMLRKFQNGDGD